ncbi:hypothetical protein TWF481_011106 [Arthrobotrys musiformis]|uniref:Uncharacterized protein n=1 Tax=Arthrobotrys musiformis TaxID=47236 RepID=A0AAV9VXB3_9PEZI
MISLLLAPLFGTLASAFYVEVVSVAFPNLGPWQLCHNTRPPQEKYELSLWAIDISSTTCEATGGDPHFQLVEAERPGSYALAGEKSKAWDAYESVENRGLRPLVTTEGSLYVALDYKVRPAGGDVTAFFEPRRYGSQISDDPTIGDVLKFVGGSSDLNPSELGLQIDLIQADVGEIHTGRKSIFRSESFPSPEADSPEVVFRISSPQRMYELNRELEAAKISPKKGFKPKEAVRNFFGGIKKSISGKVSNAKDAVKGTLKSGLEKGLASVMGGPRMKIHGLEENFEEEKEQDVVEEEGDWEDQSNWEGEDGNNLSDNWQRRVARLYKASPDSGKILGNTDFIGINFEGGELEDSWEDVKEGGGYYAEEGVIDPSVIQSNYIDEIKVEEKPKSMDIFEVEQGQPKSRPDSNSQL